MRPAAFGVRANQAAAGPWNFRSSRFTEIKCAGALRNGTSSAWQPGTSAVSAFFNPDLSHALAVAPVSAE